MENERHVRTWSTWLGNFMIGNNFMIDLLLEHEHYDIWGLNIYEIMMIYGV